MAACHLHPADGSLKVRADRVGRATRPIASPMTMLNTYGSKWTTVLARSLWI